MTPALAFDVAVLDEPLACFFSIDDSQTEVDTLGRSLDILCSASIPGGDDIQVAIENQYGAADPNHFGRLAGWYMSESGAEMGVLIAESFDPQLVRTIQEGRVVKPEHGMFLVRADGYLLGDQPIVHYTMVASSLDRIDWIKRRQRYERLRRRAADVPGGPTPAELAAQVFGRIIATGPASLSDTIQASPVTVGQYRWLRDNGDTCHVALGVAQNRVSVGSCFLKAGHSIETLELLEEARLTETDPPPARVYRRGAWWDICDFGYLSEDLPDNLGELVAARVETLTPALETHQRALVEAATSTIGP